MTKEIQLWHGKYEGSNTGLLLRALHMHVIETAHMQYRESTLADWYSIAFNRIWIGYLSYHQDLACHDQLITAWENLDEVFRIKILAQER